MRSHLGYAIRGLEADLKPVFRLRCADIGAYLSPT
jgi:hypothetical protein